MANGERVVQKRAYPAITGANCEAVARADARLLLRVERLWFGVRQLVLAAALSSDAAIQRTARLANFALPAAVLANIGLIIIRWS